MCDENDEIYVVWAFYETIVSYSSESRVNERLKGVYRSEESAKKRLEEVKGYIGVTGGYVEKTLLED